MTRTLQSDPTSSGQDELREKIIFYMKQESVAYGIRADAITTAYAEAIRSAVPEWADKAYYTKHPVVWKPVAPESNAEHYDAGFNQAIDTFTANLKNQGLLPNGKDE